MPVALKPYALTTKERLLNLGGAPSGLSDDEAHFAINRVSLEFAKHCERPLHQLEHVDSDPERHEGNGRTRLYVRSYPIVSITKVVVNGSEITDFRDSAKDRERGFIHRDNCWPMTCAFHADLTRDPDFSRQLEHIEISYKGGYKTPAQGAAATGEFELPEDIEGCLFREVVALILGDRNPGRIKSERTPGGAAFSYDLSGRIVLTPETRECLDDYAAPWII